MKKYITILLTFFLISGLKAQDCPQLIGSFTYEIAPDGVTVLFSGLTGCTDPEPNITWDFGDGGYANNTLSPQHTYADNGYFWVSMLITLPEPCDQPEHFFEYWLEIHIVAATSGSLWAEMEGPTLAAECQEVTYNVNVQGGIPPYTYSWDMGLYYAGVSCPATCDPQPYCSLRENGRSSETGTFQNSGYGHNTVYCRVTDADGNYQDVSIETRIRSGVNLEFFTNGTTPTECIGQYTVGKQIIFSPDINPMSAFITPTQYVWDMGDSHIFTDDTYGNSGILVYAYATPGTKTVVLTVSDENGSMQTSRQIVICSPTGGSSTGPACEVQLPNDLDEIIILDYEPNGANYLDLFHYSESIPPECENQDCDTEWTFFMEDCSYPHFTLTSETATYVLTTLEEDYSGQINWPVATGYHQPWGNLDVVAHTFLTGSPNLTFCETPKKRVAYLLPPELEIDGITITGICQDYKFTANTVGGAWKWNENAPPGQKKYYKNDYTWKAYNAITREEIFDLFEPLVVGGALNTKEVKINKNYFQYFTTNEYVEFIIEVTARDFANQEISATELIAFNPFRLYLKDTYYRCPGVTSTFDNDYPIVTGGGSSLVYIWSSPALQGGRPDFIAPSTGGSNGYSVTVTDGNCTLTASTTVIARPLSLSLPTLEKSCETNGEKQIGPAENQNLGGSGSYLFEWTANPAAYISFLSSTHARNPLVKQGIPAGVSVSFTLKVSDLYGNCTATATTTVISYANTVAIALPASLSTCYGDPLSVTAGIPGQQGLPPGFFCTWKYPTFPERAPLTSSSNSTSINITQQAANFPGIYPFTARITESQTGCYAEAVCNVTIRDKWKYDGYKPLVKSAVLGNLVPLWIESESNGIISPSLSTPSIIWSGTTPTNLTYVNGAPKNGKFMPDVQHPYLTMKIIDQATGCSKQFSSIRYILSDATPEWWADPSELVYCEGGGISKCIKIKFDPHLATFTPVYMPLKLKIKVILKEQSGATIALNGQDIVELTLSGSTGVYIGEFCIPAGINLNPTNPDPYREFKLDIDAGYFNVMNSQEWHATAFSEVKFRVADNPPVHSQLNYVGCVSPFSNTLIGNNRNTVTIARSCDPALPPVSNGQVYSSSGLVVAKTSISLVSDKEVLFEPAAGFQHFFIQPCIGESFVNEEIEDRIESETKIPFAAKLDDTQNSEPIFRIIPNPFQDEVTIVFQFNSIQQQFVELDLFDFTGRKVGTLKKWDNLSSGMYEEKIDVQYLPPGMYSYVLKFSNGQIIAKNSIKI